MLPAIRVLVLTVIGLMPLAGQAASASNIHWQPWSNAAFSQAEQEGKFVLLDLAAVWCHWCHVMDQKTYADPAVADYMAEHYIALKVDQDNRPDLANRYREYGWPATIVFDAQGNEIVKRAGYIAPDNFLRLLKAIVADPSPEAAALTEAITSFSGSAELNDRTRQRLQAMHRNSYDNEHGGLRLAQKFLDRDSTEYRLLQAQRGDQQQAARAKKTLDGAANLIDPVWGGVYQYSTGGDWDYPHFEKIMTSQAGYLRIYALAYAQWQRPEDLQRAQAIRDYLYGFLRGDNGAFYTSQDADLTRGKHSADYFQLEDAGRRARGIPRIDTHQYARENGWVIEALSVLYQASGDQQALAYAKQAARWAQQNRALDGGGFRHDETDAAGPYLGDTLAMGQACLALHEATGERQWLDCASAAGDFIAEHFQQQGAGFLTSDIQAEQPVPPLPRLQENIRMTRFSNRLYHYTGAERFQALAHHGMRYLATPAVSEGQIEEAGILLADYALSQAPRHFTIVGSKHDAQAKALFRVAQSQPGAYKRIEWWDRDEGPLPHADVQYPQTDKAAAYVCTNSRCSLPAFTPARYRTLIERLTAPAA